MADKLTAAQIAEEAWFDAYAVDQGLIDNTLVGTEELVCKMMAQAIDRHRPLLPAVKP